MQDIIFFVLRHGEDLADALLGDRDIHRAHHGIDHHCQIIHFTYGRYVMAIEEMQNRPMRANWPKHQIPIKDRRIVLL